MHIYRDVMNVKLKCNCVHHYYITSAVNLVTLYGVLLL